MRSSSRPSSRFRPATRRRDATRHLDSDILAAIKRCSRSNTHWSPRRQSSAFYRHGAGEYALACRDAGLDPNVRQQSGSTNEVCGALTTLTHRAWCDGTADDPAAVRRQWLRRWNESGPDASIFGQDNCPARPAAPQIVAAPAVERPAGPAVDATARSSARSVGINEVTEMELTGISPRRAHPSQIVLLSTKTPAPVGVHVQLTDARGAQGGSQRACRSSKSSSCSRTKSLTAKRLSV